MSDIVAKLRGDSHNVMREFREDGELYDFAVREFVELRRVDKDGQTSALLEVIRPGMFVYGMIDELQSSTYDQCRLRRDCLSVFYVLEFLENVTSQRAASSSAGIVSDHGEALVLKCDMLRNITGKVKSRCSANLTDLVISEDPFYISIDSIVTRMEAIIGSGEATPEFNGPRRVSLLAHADENFLFAKGGRIVRLLSSDPILRSPFDDAAANFVIPPTTTPTRTKRPMPPTSKPRGRPRKAPRTDVAREEDVISSEEAPAPIAAAASPAPVVVVSAPTSPLPWPVSPSFVERAPVQAAVETATQATVQAPAQSPAPTAAQAPVRTPAQSPVHTSAQPQVQAAMQAVLPSEPDDVEEICKPPLKFVDLKCDSWLKFKPQLADFICQQLQTPCREEVLFQWEERVREFLITFTQTRLVGHGGFGAFVNEVLRQNADSAALFLSRFPDELMRVAHVYVLMPVVYRKLCELALLDGVEVIDESIIAKARAIREKTK
jgi:hypothetical protein